MDITKQEKQDIIRYLDADKPLPDKYRFLIFKDKREVELVWNGKTNEVCNVVLPFQTIEQVDEPRAESAESKSKDEGLNLDLWDDAGITVDGRGRQLKGWNNKLIWGDNKLILSSLKNGPFREEIEAQGGIKLIYIDPPFDVGADFSMDIEIGEETLTKKPSILEEIAYRDTWGKGTDSFISMIYERLVLMQDLLAIDGSIYVHCDWRVNALIRLTMDEIFGSKNFINQIEWSYKTGGIPEKVGFSKKHDHILMYSRSEHPVFNQLLQKSYVPTLPEPHTESGQGLGVMRDDLCELCNNGSPGQKYRMVIMRDVWDDIASIFRNDVQVTGYATQKPEALLERIINASSNEGDLVADFFCGSGTTAAVAEKLNRKWIGSDLGKFAIHTTRKRMIGVQRQLKKEDRCWRAFEILNLGKYERQHYIGINPSLREEEKQKQLEAKENNFLKLILVAYRAEPTTQLSTFQGKKAGRFVAIGPVNLPVTRLYVEEIILECRNKHITKVDILGFEFEMGLFPNILDEARSKGIDLAMKYIPRDVFDKRAVEKNQVLVLERNQPLLPLREGLAARQTHDYQSNGTITLFAALDVATGEVLADCKPRHRLQEYLAFLMQIDTKIDETLDVHVIVDNYATHKHPNFKVWLAQHPRFNVQFVPTQSSWLNLVERFFTELSNKQLHRGSFTSVRRFAGTIKRYTAQHNNESKPFIWSVSANRILHKLRDQKAIY